VENYFRAADSGQADIVKSTFFQTVRFEGIRNGKLISTSGGDFANMSFKAELPSYANDVQRTIEWINGSAPGAAARVKIDIGPDRTYYDFFVLYKTAGECKIALKAFANP